MTDRAEAVRKVKGVFDKLLASHRKQAEKINALEHGVKLLEYALHLRMYGERAPGGDETWAEFDYRCEAFLRSWDHSFIGEGQRCEKCEVKPDHHVGRYSE